MNMYLKYHYLVIGAQFIWRSSNFNNFIRPYKNIDFSKIKPHILRSNFFPYNHLFFK